MIRKLSKRHLHLQIFPIDIILPKDEQKRADLKPKKIHIPKLSLG
jgi:hypothetical protein